MTLGNMRANGVRSRQNAIRRNVPHPDTFNVVKHRSSS